MSRTANALGGCTQTVVRTQNRALLRWFHEYATVDGYRSDQKSGQGSGSGKNIRLTKGRLDRYVRVFGKVCVSL